MILADENATPNDASLGVEDITSIIRQLGWTPVSHTNKNLLVYENGVDDDGKPIKLMLPNGNDFADARQRIESAIKLIAWVGNRPEADVRELIRNRGRDIFRQRLVSDTKISGLPLDLAAKIIGHLRGLIYHAACVEDDPQPFFETGKNVGRNYSRICQFGHTFAGSFGFSIEMPIPPNADATNSAVAVPFERRVMQRLARGLNDASRGVIRSDVTIMTKSYATGFNAGLCETMAALSNELKGMKAEFTMLWSPEFQVAEDLRDAPPVVIDRDVFRLYFESAAKALRTVDQSRETAITGTITQLQAATEDARAGPNRQITVQWNIGAQRTVNIRVPLAAEEYRKACDAHRDGRQITVAGIPEKLGGHWHLRSPKDFSAPPSGNGDRHG